MSHGTGTVHFNTGCAVLLSRSNTVKSTALAARDCSGLPVFLWTLHITLKTIHPSYQLSKVGHYTNSREGPLHRCSWLIVSIEQKPQNITQHPVQRWQPVSVFCKARHSPHRCAEETQLGQISHLLLSPLCHFITKPYPIQIQYPKNFLWLSETTW